MNFTSSLYQKLKLFFSGPMSFLAWLFVFLVCFYPSSMDRMGSLWSPIYGLQRDFSRGHAVIPLEDILPGLSSDSDADVTRHALRIVEQHYVQRERLEPIRMLNSGVRALAREHGGDIELAFLKLSRELSGLQLSGHRTVQLCPSSSRLNSAEFCGDSGIVVAEHHALPDSSEMKVMLRVGFRVFGVPLPGEPGLRSLDLVGRVVVPEYARLRNIPVAQAIHTYLNGILDELDPHSSYMTLEEYRELRSGTRGQFGGVGLVIDEAQELPVVREVVPNSPAHMAGIRPGDILLKVGEHLSAFRSLENVLRDVRELAVDMASPVWFFRPSSRRVFRSFLAREEIPTRSVELRTVEGHPEILHVRVTGFANHTADDVYALYEQAQLVARGKLKMILLDLRGNPGGLLDQAIQVTDLFIRRGKIVSTRSRFEEQVEQASRGLKIDLPVVVLVNSSSASASEIVAGALKDHGRALVVGERTFGKGSVQSLFELSTGTALKLTVAHYFTPAGQSLQGVGVEPHVSVKLIQPQDDHLWMSGSSEIDREEHLAAHLQNPMQTNSGNDLAHQMSLSLWSFYNSDGKSFEGSLKGLNFSYPAGDNMQTLTRLSEDPLARVGIKMGQIVFAGHTSWRVLMEKQVRDAWRKVAFEEAQALKGVIEKFWGHSEATWRLLPKNFFDLSNDERNFRSDQGALKGVAFSGRKIDATAKKGQRSMVSSLRNFMNFLGVWGAERDIQRGLPGVPGVAPLFSMSAKSLSAWQGPSQVAFSLNSSEVRAPARISTAVGLIGFKLDEAHDGPAVWIPAQFKRSSDQQWLANVRVPKAIRSYLSSVPSAGEKPNVAVSIKWRLSDAPIAVGSLQIPPMEKRYGRLVGQIVERSGRKFLQMRFNRGEGTMPQLPTKIAADADLLAEKQDASSFEVLLVTLTDERVDVVTDVVPLQRVGELEFQGETELKLSNEFRQGLGFSGIIGGIVRNSAGDLISTAALVWVGDRGIYPMEDVHSSPSIPARK